jgi:hypothetical protein
MHAVLKCTLTSVGNPFWFVTFDDCAPTCSIACVNTALKAVMIVTISTETIINMVGIVFFGFIVVTYPLKIGNMCAAESWKGSRDI